MIYNNYYYLELCVIIHAWLLLVEVFFKGKKTYSYNSFYRFLVSIRNFFWTTQELEYLFFLSRKARIFFPEYHIRLYDKNSESDYFYFSSTKIRIFFSATLGIRIFFLEKNHNPHPPPYK